MGFFSTIKGNWGKAQASVVVQGLLEMLDKRGLFTGNPSTVANNLVGAVWELDPLLFEGKSGPKPHKASVAAYSLAMGVLAAQHEQNELQYALCVALAMMMEEFRKNGRLYPFHHVDDRLIGEAAVVFAEAMAKEAERTDVEPWLC